MLASIFDDVYRLNREMNRLLYGIEKNKNYHCPKVNVYDNENEFMVVAKIPGLNKDDITINLKDNSLKISGNRKTEKREDEDVHLR